MAKLFVGNLNWDAREDDLRGLLDEMGLSYSKVVVILEQNTGRSRGFGFVHFNSEDDAVQARRELDGVELMGRPVHVEEAVEKERPGGGRGGGRGRSSAESRGRSRRGSGGRGDGDRDRGW